MKKVLIASALSAIMALPMSAIAADYKIDTTHAFVNFKVSHLGYSFIQGRFNKFEGQFSYDEKNVAASKVTINVNTTSLDSNHAERDKHLKSDDYINAGKFSTAKFVSTSVAEKADGGLAITGDMTFHGVTKPLVVDAKIIGQGDDPWGNYRTGLEATARLELAEFGMNVKGASTYVDLDIVLEGIRQ
ncbi:YceI family protein [Psychromonas arctica]|uniref:YceI family protein n=1 Tax=Psychromonas arctica TaxID=168275 RepID=A0ABU9HC54_9GAMM|nr:YceI family protein [Psychromonas sp. L1A2]